MNPPLVRAVETQASGGCKITFDRSHGLTVDASLYGVRLTMAPPRFAKSQ